MIRDEDGALTGYVYLNLKTNDYGGYVNRAEQLLHQKLALPAATPGTGPENMSSNCAPSSDSK